MKQIGVAVIGTGWCGGIRAEALARHALVKSLHLAEIRPERLDELKAKLEPASASADYKPLLANREIEAVYISATPESTHYPITRDALNAGKHVFLEKPHAIDPYGIQMLREGLELALRSGTIAPASYIAGTLAYVEQALGRLSDAGKFREPALSSPSGRSNAQSRPQERSRHA